MRRDASLGEEDVCKLDRRVSRIWFGSCREKYDMIVVMTGLYRYSKINEENLISIQGTHKKPLHKRASFGRISWNSQVTS